MWPQLEKTVVKEKRADEDTCVKPQHGVGHLVGAQQRNVPLCSVMVDAGSSHGAEDTLVLSPCLSVPWTPIYERGIMSGLTAHHQGTE